MEDSVCVAGPGDPGLGLLDEVVIGGSLIRTGAGVVSFFGAFVEMS